MATSTIPPHPEKAFAVGESLYFTTTKVGSHELVQLVHKNIEQYGRGPHIIKRVDISEVDGEPRLKFKGPISAGRGEGACSPQFEKEICWHAIYFTRDPGG